MKIGEVEVFLNYGQLMVGSDSDPDFDLLVSTPPANDAHHVMLTARAQIAPVRVSVWRGTAPRASRPVFNGEVVLSTGYLALREASDPPFFVWPVTSAGTRVGLSIGVDAWDEATTVTVVVDPDAQSMPDVRSRDDFIASAAAITEISQIDRVLTGYSYPVDRLAVAIRIMRDASGEGVSEARVRYGITSVAEWLKWLHPAISARVLPGIEELLRNYLVENSSEQVAAGALIAYIASELGLSGEEFLMAR
ncbi:hypothetical protein ABZT17_03480 [Streptomyces sp. NPDC005648]|uniref:hypothetical protein n=1 Tax=Streptomyces sp. NPDC005648 TaxID=3157044 RepID=UPI0033AA9885